MKKVFNLISADMGRLIKSKPVYITLIINVGLLALNVLLLGWLLRSTTGGVEMDIGEELFRLVLLSAFASSNLGLFVGIAVSIFSSGDFAFNTFRNKIIAGNSRMKIYLSTLAVGLIIGMVFFVVNFIVSLFGAAIVSQGFHFTGELIGIIALFIPLYLAITATIVFVSMAVKSRAAGIGINLGFVMFMSVALVIIMAIPGRFAEILLMSVPHSIVDRVAMQAMMMGEGTVISGRFVGVALLVSAIYFVVSTVLGAIKFKYTSIK
ncbi:MAG: ABC transporter permease [Firmicutes bacterium]|nr:ABC transporter permease [Bacillota bacterium]